MAAVSIENCVREMNHHVSSRNLTSHVCEFFASGFKIISILGLNSVLDGTWHGIVGRQNCALDELDLTGGVSLQTTSRRSWTTRLSALPPVVYRTRLASSVWGISS